MSYRKETILLLLTIGIIARVWHWSVNEKKEQLQQANDANKVSEPIAVATAGATLNPENHSSSSPSSQQRIHFPVEGRSRKHVISFFGDPRQGGRRLHQGVDIAAPQGTKVLAALSGRVERVKTGGKGGKQVWLKADNGWMFYYGHLHEQLVEEEQRVKEGAVLGTVGNTGNARNASPHLHFEIHTEKEQAVNPLPYISLINP